jgi:cell wall-associated NlpC family hydrolase
VVPLTRAGANIATTISAAKAKAAQIQQEIQSTGQQIDALDQQYDAAQAHKAALDQQIAATRAKIAQTQATIAGDRDTLKKAAVNAYVSNGAAAAQDPLFSGNQSSTMAARVYNDVAEGNLGTAVSDLNTAQNQLDAQQAVLTTQDGQATQAVSNAQAAANQAKSLQTQQTQALRQANGQIAQLITEQQKQEQEQATQAAAAKLAQAKAAAATAAQAAASHTSSSGSSSSGGTAPVVHAPVPPAGGGAGATAVQAAESYLTVPYQWGGASRSGVDCSGLTMLAWEAAGVGLPHYSGGQMSDSTRISLSTLEPGDLLFYGPGGSEHVAMYIGGGQMIEAPYTGEHVWIVALRTGTGSFAGAGRP